MDKDYFEGKKKMTTDSLNESLNVVESALRKIECWQYSVPMIFDVHAMHHELEGAEKAIRNARRDFEKVRWALSESESDFEQWLLQSPYSNLI